MLNELLSLSRSLEQAGFEINVRHKAIKEAKSGSTLRVLLNPDGSIEEVVPVPVQAIPWTLRDGQKNSFPFVQLKNSLLEFADYTLPIFASVQKKGGKNHENLEVVCQAGRFNADRHKNWMPKGYLDSIAKRLQEIQVNSNNQSQVACAAMERFIQTCTSADSSVGLLEAIVSQITSSLQYDTSSELLNCAYALLIGKNNKGAMVSDGALLFDAAGFSYPIYHDKVVSAVSDALYISSKVESNEGKNLLNCQVSGAKTDDFITDTFPQPNLPTVGQTCLFSKNKDNPSFARYGRGSVGSFRVATETADNMAAALTKITEDDLKGKTWSSIPGEKPKQTDLLIAFLQANPNTGVVKIVLEDEDPDDKPEESNQSAKSIGNFKESVSRFIDEVRGKSSEHYDQELVNLLIIRKLNAGNHKIVFNASLTVDGFHRAAQDWATAEENAPDWLTISLPFKGIGMVRKRPPHIPPLSLISFTKVGFIRGGKDKVEMQGLPASEIMRLFMTAPNEESLFVSRILQLFIARRGELLSGFAHENRRSNDVRDFDRIEVLRTISVLSILLHKLERSNNMSSAAFQLGQLLAAADIVHVGYCNDIRGGAIPPSLLGNQIYSLALRSPVKALEVMGRRWKPYAGWVRRISSSAEEHSRIERMTQSKDKVESDKGWSIKKALRHARECGELSAKLKGMVSEIAPNSIYRAELMLGYMAGLPKSEKPETKSTDNNSNTEGENNE